MIGTIRTFDPKQKQQIYDAMKRLVENTAEASGATATFEFDAYANPVTYNNPELTARVLPSLRKVAGAANVKEIPLITGVGGFRVLRREDSGVLLHGGRHAERHGRAHRAG